MSGGGRGEAVLLPAAEPEDQRRDAGGHQQRPAHIDAAAATGPLPGRQPRDQREHDGDDRRVDQEHRPPAEVLGEQPAGHDPGGRARRGGGLPDRQRPVARGPFGVGRRQQRQRGRGDHRPGRALHDPGDDQHDRPLREPAGQRRDPEQGQAGGQHLPPAEQVRQAAARQQQRPERQRVPGDDPLQLRRGHAQLPLDRRQRHVHDAEVQLQHELGGADQRDDKHGPPRAARSGQWRGAIRRVAFHWRISCPDCLPYWFIGVNHARQNADAGPAAVRADTLHLPDR